MGMRLAGAFTFYCSSIKTFGPSYTRANFKKFTFYCSSIKTNYALETMLFYPKFTFYCSSIKTVRVMCLQNL